MAHEKEPAQTTIMIFLTTMLKKIKMKNSEVEQLPNASQYVFPKVCDPDRLLTFRIAMLKAQGLLLKVKCQNSSKSLTAKALGIRKIFRKDCKLQHNSATLRLKALSASYIIHIFARKWKRNTRYVL